MSPRALRGGALVAALVVAVLAAYLVIGRSDAARMSEARTGEVIWQSQMEACARDRVARRLSNRTDADLRLFYLAAATAREADYRHDNQPSDLLAYREYRRLGMRVTLPPLTVCRNAYPPPFLGARLDEARVLAIDPTALD